MCLEWFFGLWSSQSTFLCSSTSQDLKGKRSPRRETGGMWGKTQRRKIMSLWFINWMGGRPFWAAPMALCLRTSSHKASLCSKDVISFVLIFFFVSLPIICSPQSRKSEVYTLINQEAGRKECSCDIQGCLCCDHVSSQLLNFLGLVFKIFIFCQVNLNLVVFPILMDSLCSYVVPGTKSF